MDTEACTWPESLIPLILPQPKPCVGGRGNGASSPSVWACEEGAEPWAGGSPSCGRCPVRSSSGAEGRSSPSSPSSCRSCGVLRCPETGRSLPPAAPGRGRGLRRSAPPAGAHRKAAPQRPEKQGSMCPALVFSLGLRLMFVDLDKPSVEQKLQCMRPFLIGDTGAAQGCGSGWARGNQPAGLGSEFSHCGHPRLWASVPGHSKENMCL